MLVLKLVLIFKLLSVCISPEPPCMCPHCCCQNGCDTTNDKEEGFESVDLDYLHQTYDEEILKLSYGCFCWINNNREFYGYSGGFKYMYQPHTEFIEGACKWCGSSISSKTTDILDIFCKAFEGKCHNMLNLEEEVEGIDKWIIKIENEKVKSVYRTSVQKEIKMVGNEPACIQDCKDYQAETNAFENGTYTVNYWPTSEFSDGHCDCTGWIDPCRYHDL